MKKPMLVSMGMFGITSREAAIKLFWISIALSVLILLTSSQWPSVRPTFAIFLLLCAVVTRCSIYWNDRNDGWKAWVH